MMFASKSLITFLYLVYSLLHIQLTVAFFPTLHFQGENAVVTGTPQCHGVAFRSVILQPSARIAAQGVPLFGKKEARAEGNARKGASERLPKKPKDDVIEISGVVIDSLPNAMFRVTIDGAPETQEPILATISGKIRKNFVKILVGDKVKVELSPYDLTRGRITFRSKAFPPS